MYNLETTAAFNDIVQDIIIGLTLIFSDAINIGDLIETSGQIGRVDSIGLRFTKLTTLHGQSIFLPNRNITLISKYRRAGIYAQVHIEVPEHMDGEQITREAQNIARGMYHQFRAIILREPVVSDVKLNTAGGWSYLIVRFRLWPGQTSMIDIAYRQRLLSILRECTPEYPDWKISVTYGAEKTSS